LSKIKLEEKKTTTQNNVYLLFLRNSNKYNYHLLMIVHVSCSQNQTERINHISMNTLSRKYPTHAYNLSLFYRILIHDALFYQLSDTHYDYLHVKTETIYIPKYIHEPRNKIVVEQSRRDEPQIVSTMAMS